MQPRQSPAVIAVVMLALLLLPALASAGESRPTLAELERELMCPTCKQVLELSDAPVADRIRAFVKARIAAGDTKSEIKSKLVSQFGEAVLASPPTSGFNLLAWLLPLVGVGAAGGMIGALAWRWARLGSDAALGASALREQASDPALERPLDEELARLDR